MFCLHFNIFASENLSLKRNTCISVLFVFFRVFFEVAVAAKTSSAARFVWLHFQCIKGIIIFSFFEYIK